MEAEEQRQEDAVRAVWAAAGQVSERVCGEGHREAECVSRVVGLGN